LENRDISLRPANVMTHWWEHCPGR